MERNDIIRKEVEKLLVAGHIRPVQYPEWLANVVLVPKPNKKWRMCIDFTDLNRACPKDSYPLPRIDALVDSTAGCEMMSFLDAFQGIIKSPWNLKTKKKLALSPNRAPSVTK
ncbi:UNVERIFIED_CONTAM: Transposon Ty3-G Gag-Pol polyprotein [Sesamum radiatum]|uniref:Transposon Ty3-G Gag-Pol polyprotein n=1 Tax=Sesamum radiatum TaxID=300843 RepID=A0AAW2LLU5_SESRA